MALARHPGRTSPDSACRMSDVSRSRRHPNVAQIAALAGVSPSTVDRVLNERGSVSDTLRRRVIDAARTLNVRRILPSANHGVLHFDVVLPGTGMAHYQRLHRAIHEHAQLIGSRVAVHRVYWNEGDEAGLLRFLQHPPYRRSGLMIMAPDVARVRSTLRRLSAAGLPVVTVTSDISGIGPHPYVGIDNAMAGRTVADLLGRLVRGPGRVLLPVASMDFRDHIERIAGFRSVIAERFPQLRLEAPAEHRDREDLAFELTRAALARHDDIVAIYNTGSVAMGIQRALQSLPRERWPVWFGHEASLEHARMMAAGDITAVIDQDPEAQALVGLRHLLHACGELDEAVTQRPTRFRIVTAESVVWDELSA
jgi:LacI family transcriptional regulator